MQCLLLYKETQYLGALPEDETVSPDHVWVKDPLKEQGVEPWVLMQQRTESIPFAVHLQETTTCQRRTATTVYLKRLLQFTSLFQPRICVRPDRLHMLQPKTCQQTDLSAETGVRTQLSSEVKH